MQCSHQLWRLSAASCPLMTNDVFYVPSLLNDSQRHVTVEECQQVATQKRRMSPVWRKVSHPVCILLLQLCYAFHPYWHTAWNVCYNAIMGSDS